MLVAGEASGTRFGIRDRESKRLVATYDPTAAVEAAYNRGLGRLVAAPARQCDWRFAWFRRPPESDGWARARTVWCLIASYGNRTRSSTGPLDLLQRDVPSEEANGLPGTPGRRAQSSGERSALSTEAGSYQRGPAVFRRCGGLVTELQQGVPRRVPDKPESLAGRLKATTPRPVQRGARRELAAARRRFERLAYKFHANSAGGRPAMSIAVGPDAQRFSMMVRRCTSRKA